MIEAVIWSVLFLISSLIGLFNARWAIRGFQAFMSIDKPDRVGVIVTAKDAVVEGLSFVEGLLLLAIGLAATFDIDRTRVIDLFFLFAASALVKRIANRVGQRKLDQLAWTKNGTNGA